MTDPALDKLLTALEEALDGHNEPLAFADISGDARSAGRANALATRIRGLRQSAAADDARLELLTETLLGVASATFDARATRTYSGDRLDVLAFLVNATADEVEIMVRELESEREELQRAQDQLIASEKLAVLGRLAAGVAHEMNQPLTVVHALTELMSEQPGDKIDDHLEDLRMIREAAAQMAQIVSNVRGFGQPSEGEHVATPAAKPLQEAETMMRRQLLERGIALDWAIAGDLPPVRISAERLQQVFVNLLSNARDALSQMPRDQRRVTLAATARDGRVVYIVEDSGPGIPEGVRPRLFEPFFSTKDVGAGTGLGLSLSLGIVREHSGTLRHQPTPGGGARFVVEIPALEPDADE